MQPDWWIEIARQIPFVLLFAWYMNEQQKRYTDFISRQMGALEKLSKRIETLTTVLTVHDSRFKSDELSTIINQMEKE